MDKCCCFIPASSLCSNFHLLLIAYRGASGNLQYHIMFECVDKNPDSIPGSASGLEGAFFLPVEATCTGMPCPPYDPQKELTCAVCTK